MKKYGEHLEKTMGRCGFNQEKSADFIGFTGDMDYGGHAELDRTTFRIDSGPSNVVCFFYQPH